MAFWKQESYKDEGATLEKESYEKEAEDDIIRLSDLEAIAQKVRDLPRAYDIQAHELNLTVKERRLVNAIEVVAKLSLFNEFKHLKDKIKNHHHVVLSIDDGVAFRENGNHVKNPTRN